MDEPANFEFSKGGIFTSGGPPMLDKASNKIEGLAFIGLSLTRNHSTEEQPFAHPDSISRQTQYNFNLIQDREYKYFCATNDDGWLVGGGENGESFKLASVDSAHCEIMRIGTFNEDWGGISVERIVEVMTSGQILIPHMAILPSFVMANKDSPPETELKFELEKNSTQNFETWGNWQLSFLMNQLFREFTFPARFCPGPHHMTFVRKSAWRSKEHMREYFANCSKVVKEWRKLGPLCLEPENNPMNTGYISNPLDNELTEPHGVYLFRDRLNIIKYFAPNFHPPYNTPEKREIIRRVLSVQWDEKNLRWVHVDL